MKTEGRPTSLAEFGNWILATSSGFLLLALNSVISKSFAKGIPSFFLKRRSKVGDLKEQRKSSVRTKKK